MILYAAISNYIAQFLPVGSDIINSVEAAGHKQQLPLIQPTGAHALRFLTDLHQPEIILEIGTAIGYSAIHLAEAAPKAEIITLEMDAGRAGQAVANIQKAGLSDRIHVVVGDAEVIIPKLEQRFDMIFLDAAKGKYELFFELVFPKWKDGGLLIADNVLFRGMVALEDDQIDRKYRSMVKKLKQFNQMLAEHDQIETLFLPVGDGLAVSRKLKRGDTICIKGRNY